MIRALLRSPAMIYVVWLPLYRGALRLEPARRIAIIARFGGKHALDECRRLTGRW